MSYLKFTVRLHPYQGESLSSFMIRFAEGNGIDLLALWNFVRKSEDRYVQMSNICVLDFAPINVIDIDKLVEVSGLDKCELLSTTFYYALDKFCCDRDLERSRFLSEMIRDCYYFCPDCLKEKPFYRLVWNITDIKFCTTHKRLLENMCPHCKIILYRGAVREITRCPHCGLSLLTHNEKIAEVFDLESQEWCYSFWNYLLAPSTFKINSNELAIKALFLLNDFKLEFNRERIKDKLENELLLPSLLQNARGSLSQQRVLHISFIQKLLGKYNYEISSFLNMDLDDNFQNSIKEKARLKSEGVACRAPWCKSYLIKGSLIKSGTSSKTRENGTKFVYYLYCPDCGCDYAFDERNNLVERTYFIDSYNKLLPFKDSKMSIKEISKTINMTEDRLRRCIAYFSSRELFLLSNIVTFKLDIILLNKFKNSVTSGAKIKEIRKWTDWTSYMHFLQYRYNIEVINAEKRQQRKRVMKLSTDIKMAQVERALTELIQQKEYITIRKVCEKLQVYPETIRNWGCNKLIADYKGDQKKQTIDEFRDYAAKKVEEYLSLNINKRVCSKELYSYIGKNRTVIVRDMPDLTRRIHSLLMQHNNLLKLG